jgi:5-bromo-4-chloroindolyl phosphate hydrolysis protein
VENQKINVLFYTSVIIFLAVCMILIKEFNVRRANDFKEYTYSVVTIVKRDNDRMKALYNELAAEQKENEYLRSTLTDTRNALDNIGKKLSQPAPATASK